MHHLTFVVKSSYGKLFKNITTLFGILLISSACSDELSQDTNMIVLVRGFEKEPARDTDLESSSPSSLVLQLAQVSLVTASEKSSPTSGTEPTSTGVLTGDQTKEFSIINRDTRVYETSLKDTFINVDYGRVEVYFKVNDKAGSNAFKCTDSKGVKIGVTETVIDSDYSESSTAGKAGCNDSGRLCKATITDFSSSLLSIGGRLDKSFSIKKTEAVSITVQINWKNTLDQSGGSCRVPDFEISIDT